MPAAAIATLDARTWRARRDAHEARIAGWLAPHLDRRSRGQTHPVEDFLFTYYTYRPAALRRWHPGLGVRLDDGAEAYDGRRGYLVDRIAGTAWADPGLARQRHAQVQWIRDLLAAIESRPPEVGCFGLHEWAMIYRQRPDELRHDAHPLRLGSGGTDTVVEQHRINCTHFDAFRFFTDPARPRNRLQPTRDSQQTLDQPGCLHTTMDLYKWSYKLSPLTPSEIVADCFALAREVRQVDMQAAPYDLSEHDVEPIRIETVAGKQEYVARQRDFAERAAPLRRRLIRICDSALVSARQPAVEARA